MSSHLILDLGNTRAKAFLFEKNEMIASVDLDGFSTAAITAFIPEKKVNAAIIGSSVNISKETVDELRSNFPVLLVDQNTKLPVKNAYSTTDTLGYDRMAAAIGARQLFPGVPVLAIVAGTCITYNIISDESFLGGAISPGLQMRAKAMNAFTEKLPLVEIKATPLLGNSTETALQAGVYHGAHEEIKGMTAGYEKQFPGLKTALGGGDATLLAMALKNGIFARPNLVAEGLNRILQFHAENNLL